MSVCLSQGKKTSKLQTLSNFKCTAIKIENQVKDLAGPMCIIFTIASNILKLGPHPSCAKCCTKPQKNSTY